MSRRRLDLAITGLRRPKWLDEYKIWHPLYSTAYDLYPAEGFAREARRYKAGRQLLKPAYEELQRFENPELPQRARVAAGERGVKRFRAAIAFLEERKRAAKTRERRRLFPVLAGRSTWPFKPLCPQCGGAKVMEPHSMAILAGGAMRTLPGRAGSAERATDCIGFLDLHWHGAHDRGTGVDREIDVNVPLAVNTPKGQFELYFCSTSCLRKFLNDCVDELDARVDGGRASRSKKRAPTKK